MIYVLNMSMVIILSKVVWNNGFIKTANPGKNAIAGISDIDQCQKGSPTYKGCNIINNIKDSMRKQSPPYPDAFFKRSLIGENSSSYFIRTGNCEKSNLNEKECKRKKYSWVSNPLYKQIPDYLNRLDFYQVNVLNQNIHLLKINLDFI